MKSTYFELIGLFIVFSCAAFINLWLVGVLLGLLIFSVGATKELTELKAPERERDHESL